MIFITQKDVTQCMPESWKCFRCDLVFGTEGHARLHVEISGHSVARLRLAA